MSRKRLLLARLAPYYTRIRHPRVFDNVRHFCMFVGHGRSGSTLVGALLNAHPQIVLSNELDVFEYVDQKLSQEQIFNLILYMSRLQAKRGSQGGGGYEYPVPGQWQGRHREIRVIGDRKAGATAIKLFRRPQLLADLQDTVRVPLRFVCVARNPFDTLTTTLKKTTRLPGETERRHLERQIDHYFERYAAVSLLIEKLGADKVKIVLHERLVADARSTLTDLCGFLGVKAERDYLDDCAAIVKPQPNVTRTKIEWPSDLIEAVRNRMTQIPWLQDYAFDDSARAPTVAR